MNIINELLNNKNLPAALKILKIDKTELLEISKEDYKLIYGGSKLNSDILSKKFEQYESERLSKINQIKEYLEQNNLFYDDKNTTDIFNSKTENKIRPEKKYISQSINKTNNFEDSSTNVVAKSDLNFSNYNTKFNYNRDIYNVLNEQISKEYLSNINFNSKEMETYSRSKIINLSQNMEKYSLAKSINTNMSKTLNNKNTILKLRKARITEYMDNLNNKISAIKVYNKEKRERYLADHISKYNKKNERVNSILGNINKNKTNIIKEKVQNDIDKKKRLSKRLDNIQKNKNIQKIKMEEDLKLKEIKAKLIEEEKRKYQSLIKEKNEQYHSKFKENYKVVCEIKNNYLKSLRDSLNNKIKRAISNYSTIVENRSLNNSIHKQLKSEKISEIKERLLSNYQEYSEKITKLNAKYESDAIIKEIKEERLEQYRHNIKEERKRKESLNKKNISTIKKTKLETDIELRKKIILENKLQLERKRQNSIKIEINKRKNDVEKNNKRELIELFNKIENDKSLLNNII